MTLNRSVLAFHLMVKPAGASCNLRCQYCFYLPKKSLHSDDHVRMSNEVLKEYTRQYIEAQSVPEVTFAWQGGEPTLMGLDFYRRAIGYQQQFRRPGMTIYNTLQTNGILIDEEWCTFLREHNFLVGLSLDGPQELHDAYRTDEGGRPTFNKVIQAFELLRKDRVEVNILTCIHAANQDHPLEVYRFFRDELGSQFIQLIPIVERTDGSAVTERSVSPDAYGKFLITVFDEWLQKDVGRVFVQMFDASLAAWAGAPPGLCTLAPTCGAALVLEHNGDVYSCDHFVALAYLVGNIKEKHLSDLVASGQQYQFGIRKRDMLPHYCQVCDVRFVCNGECPRNRFMQTPDGESGLNYLCSGYKEFFHHIDKPMRTMSNLLHQGRAPAEIMNMV
ncbi:MAG: anaerobic sulfatase maturase [Chloroflexi bacterium]|nr:anaerobic sulfatase maturase [Chloroflexota bacterium]